MNKKIPAKFLILIVLVTSMSSELFAESSLCKIAEKALIQAEKIRGLKRKEAVPCKLQTKEEVKKYLLSVIDEKVSKERLDSEEYVYKVLGLIPENFDYKEGLVNLYVSQLGGYYDPEQNHFVMAAWIPEMMQNTIAVHELTHALQDQHFNLDNFLDNKDRTSDELLARSAVVEGDATAVMTDYTRSLMGHGGIAEDPDVSSMILQNIFGAALVGESSGVPQSLSLLIIFPYTSGLRFSHHILKEKKDYKSLNAFLENPPKTTEEILHPELILSNKKSYELVTDSELRGDDTDDSWELGYTDSMGEFITSILIAVQTDDREKAANTAAGWGGDRVGVFTHRETKTKRLTWYSKWDSEKDAREFYDAMTLILANRFKSSEQEVFEWKGEKLIYRILNKGKTIILTADEMVLEPTTEKEEKL